MRRSRTAPALAISSTLLVLGISSLAAGCGEKLKYKPEPAYSGAKANIPAVPKIPDTASFKTGSNWTIYGLQHQLNNPRHRPEVEGKPATIEGYVVDIYRPKEPTPKGIDCAPVKYEPPHFYIADSKDEKNPAKMITVMGYASSYIQQQMARDEYKKKNLDAAKIAALKPDDQYMDNNYSSQITILGEPRIGSKVIVSGQFGSKYQEGQGGTRSSPFGIIDVTSHKKGKIDYKEGSEEIPELK
jgi:hypothetical protein